MYLAASMQEQKVTTFTRNLRHIRTKVLDTKQSHMAMMIGVKTTTYAAWEQGWGHAKHPHLIKISEMSGVSIDDLLKKELSKEEVQEDA